MPYSDPMMDGVTIQRAGTKALQRGVRTRDAFAAVEAVASRGTPAVVMTYWNLIERYGADRFARDLASAGGAGAITPDLTPDEAEEWLAVSDAHGLDRIFLVSPSSTDERLRLDGGGLPRLGLRHLVDGRDRPRAQTSAAAPELVGGCGDADPSAHGRRRAGRIQRRAGARGDRFRRSGDRRLRAGQDPAGCRRCGTTRGSRSDCAPWSPISPPAYALAAASRDGQHPAGAQSGTSQPIAGVSRDVSGTVRSGGTWSATAAADTARLSDHHLLVCWRRCIAADLRLYQRHPAGSDGPRTPIRPATPAGSSLPEPYAMPEVTLTDTSGRPYNLSTTPSKPVTLLFFGYTHCPDVCVAVLSDVSLALQRLARGRSRPDPGALRHHRPRPGQGEADPALSRSVQPEPSWASPARCRPSSARPARSGWTSQGMKKLPSGGYEVGHSAQVIGFSRNSGVVIWTPGTPIGALKHDFGSAGGAVPVSASPAAPSHRTPRRRRCALGLDRRAARPGRGVSGGRRSQGDRSAVLGGGGARLRAAADLAGDHRRLGAAVRRDRPRAVAARRDRHPSGGRGKRACSCWSSSRPSPPPRREA